MTKRAHWSPHKLVAGLVALPGKSGVPVRVGVFAQRHCVNSVRLVAALKALGLLSPVTPNAKSGKEAGIDPNGSPGLLRLTGRAKPATRLAAPATTEVLK
jgi:hypothetical protein